MQQLRNLGRFDVSARMGRLATLPVLVLGARHDPISRPEYARRLTAAIPGARHVEVPDAGHGVTIQRAALINRLLAEHFASADAS